MLWTNFVFYLQKYLEEKGEKLVQELKEEYYKEMNQVKMVDGDYATVQLLAPMKQHAFAWNVTVRAVQ